MWTRKELKERAREALKRNYWKTVAVVLLIIVLGGGTGSAVSGSRAIVSDEGTDGTVTGDETSDTVLIMENEGVFDDPATTAAENISDKVEAGVSYALESAEQMNAVHIVVLAVVIIVFVVIFITAAAAIDVFVINPLLVGAQRFMLKSVDGKGKLAELGYTFDHNYKNGVKTTFYRDMSIFLWALLFFIPGIYKGYQYYLVDYILAENPDMPYKEVLERSKMMMDGQKWNTFVLDLSFIPWRMLSFFTCGLSEIFYVRPYLYLTHASLYRALCAEGRSTVEEAE